MCDSGNIGKSAKKKNFPTSFQRVEFQIINSSTWKMINFWVKEFNFIRKKESGRRHTVLCRSILNSAKLDDRVQKIIHHAERDSKDIAHCWVVKVDFSSVKSIIYEKNFAIWQFAFDSSVGLNYRNLYTLVQE